MTSRRRTDKPKQGSLQASLPVSVLSNIVPLHTKRHLKPQAYRRIAKDGAAVIQVPVVNTLEAYLTVNDRLRQQLTFDRVDALRRNAPPTPAQQRAFYADLYRVLVAGVSLEEVEATAKASCRACGQVSSRRGA